VEYTSTIEGGTGHEMTTKSYHKGTPLKHCIRQIARWCIILWFGDSLQWSLQLWYPGSCDIQKPFAVYAGGSWLALRRPD